MERFDAIIIGAGAAGMFCSALAGQAGRRVLLIDNGKKPGRKILMSGGGRCNFTNLYVEPGAYLSQNPHFCKSALARFTQWDFIDLVNKHGIAWHEKTLGQLFCDDSAQQIVDMLVDECEKGNVAFRLRSEVLSVAKDDTGFTLELNGMTVGCEKLVIATGGLSMPGLGASPFGYKIAEQFGLNVLPTRAGLVPFTLHKPLLEELQVLAGVAVPSVITAENGTVFRENLLFTHRGLSGPAVLQISSYWQPGEFVSINLLPDVDLETFLNEQRNAHPNQSLKNTLAVHLPKRLVERLQQLGQIPDRSTTSLFAWLRRAKNRVKMHWWLAGIFRIPLVCGWRAGLPVNKDGALMSSPTRSINYALNCSKAVHCWYGAVIIEPPPNSSNSPVGRNKAMIFSHSAFNDSLTNTLYCTILSLT